MRKIKPFERRLRLIFGTNLGLLIAVVALTYTSINRLVSNSYAVIHTHSIIAAVDRTTIDHGSMRVAVRNFIILGRESDRRNYLDAADHIENDLVLLKELAQDDVEPLSRTTHDYEAVTTKIFNGGDGITLLKSGVIDRESRKVIEASQAVLNKEQRLLVRRQKNLIEYTSTVYRVIPFLAAAVVGTTILSYAHCIKKYECLSNSTNSL